MKKKLLTILLTLVMVLAMIPMTTGVASAVSTGTPITIDGYNNKVIIETDLFTLAGVTLKDGGNFDLEEKTYYLDEQNKSYISYSATDGIKIVLYDFSTKKKGSFYPESGIDIDDLPTDFPIDVEFNGNNVIDTREGGIDVAGNLSISVNGSLEIGKNETCEVGITTNNVTFVKGNVDIKASGIGVMIGNDITVLPGASVSVLLDVNQTQKDTIKTRIENNIKPYSDACVEFVSGIQSHLAPCCIQAESIAVSSGDIEDLYYLSIEYNAIEFLIKNMTNMHTFVPKDQGVAIPSTNATTATDIIFSPTAGVKVTLNGGGVVYPEVWEPYYETLALKIAAQAEIEAAKMLEEANVETSVVEEEKPIELVASTERMIAPDGKDSVKVTWVEKYGRDLDFEGYEIFRATTLDGEYIAMFDTTNEWYYNTLIKKGDKYFYKVRGYKTVDDEKVYTAFSDVVERQVEK